MANTRSLQVYKELKKRIIIGELAQRERLSENSLSEELNVSRTPIREAIKMLERDGLVSRDTLGVFITALSKKEVKDLYVVRKELEGLAAEQAALNSNEEMLRILEGLVMEMKKCLNSGDIISWIEINGKFHEHIALMSGNCYLKHVLTDIRARLALARGNSLIATKRSSTSLAEHSNIAEALINKDAKRAKEYAQQHSQSAADFFLDNLL